MSELIKTFKGSIFSKILISYVFIVSGLVINVIQLFTLVIWPFNKILYRKLNCYMQYILLSYVTALAQWWSGTTIEFYGNEDDFKYLGKENFIGICNHKYEIDFLLGFLSWQKCNMLVGAKAFFKDSVKYLPVLGLSWYLSENIFLKRNWQQDKKTLTTNLNSIFDYPKDFHFSVVIFCEGTRFTEEKHKASIEYAKSKNLPQLRYHLYPRSKGFITLIDTVSEKFDAVYDFTFAVEKCNNGELPSMASILKGQPACPKVFFRRIPISAIPKNDEKKCEEFLLKLYQEKDEIFDVFVKTGDYSSIGKKVDIKKPKRDLYIVIFSVLFILPITFYYLLVKLFYGSIYFKLTFIVIIFIVNIITKYLTRSTQVKHGSQYGIKKND